MPSHSAQIDELDPTRDKPAVFAWLRSFLRWHLDTWSRATGLHWSEDTIDDHIDARGLVERDWGELVAAHDDDAQHVAVARSLGRAVGIVHCQERVDRYLQINMGVVAWIFVEPVSRGSGVSTLLIEDSRAWMKQRGHAAGEVFVSADNPAAIKVYRRGGYEIVDHRMLARLD